MTERPDAQAFEASMRQEFLKKENLAKLFNLVLPHLTPGSPALVYILAQTNRIGHFMIEAQILKTLYADRYDRIIVITPPMHQPGTNALIPACFGDPFVWVAADEPVFKAMGFVDGGLADLQHLHLLLQSPRVLIVEFWRKVAAGTRPAVITLPDQIRERGHAQLRSIGIDPEAPLAFFHVRTADFTDGYQRHAHRSTTVEPYAPSIRRILDAGYQVVRLGEPGLEPPDWMGDGYVSLPDALPDRGPQDRAVDLTVLADAAFGTAQNSGPIWVAAAFGVPTLRTSTPFEHLNLPYNRDMTLFKRYRDRSDGRFLGYGEILERRLPAVLRDAEFDEKGIDLVDNSAEEIDAATLEFLSLVSGEPGGLSPDRVARFLALGRAYESAIAADPWFRRENLDFYGYAHPFGTVAAAQLDADPGYLD